MKKLLKYLKINYVSILILILIILCGNISVAKEQSEMSKIIIYFFSPTCSSCEKVSEYISQLEVKYKSNIIKYNITTKENKKLFNAYCSNYNVSEEHNYVPIVFIGNKYLVGKHMIFEQLEDEIVSSNKVKTLLLKSNDGNLNKDTKMFNNIKWISVFVAGIVNGINPCSIAMFIFLLSLCFVDKDKIKKIVATYILGKFLTFLVLGTILYKILTYINFGFINTITKVISLIISLILVICNLLDLIELKHNQYNNIRLQLPLRVRKFNHMIMGKIKNAMEKKYLLVIVFFISVLVSLGEFMCTGQIYLITIVTAIQYLNQFNAKAIWFLIIYNIALVLPILVVALLINKGKNIFQMSEYVREKMPVIKIMNIIILLLIAVVIIVS